MTAPTYLKSNQMTYQQLYRQTKNTLLQAGIESPAFDASCLIKLCFGIDRQALIMRGNETAPAESISRLQSLTERRARGEPLQYLLGSWEFMGRKFSVGPGVLIPREDTQVTVQETLRRLSPVACPRVADLCAGSGAIAVTLAKELPQSAVTALELSLKAFGYLKKNIRYNHAENVRTVCGDVFTAFRDFERESFDAIVSNPPYIETKEIGTLQREIFYEPKMALDGGPDGLVFYRAIIRDWTPLLRRGGIMAFEVGEGQAPTVKLLLLEHGFSDIQFQKDIGGTNRCVSAIKI